MTADQAEIRVSFAAHEPDRSRAVSALAGRMAAVDDVVRREGVEVRRRTVHVGDRWSGKRRVGVTAQQSLVLQIKDVAVLDDLLAGLFSAEPEWLDGPHWSLADETTVLREAQRLAVADARARAEAYAAALGGRLGKLLRLSDEGAERPYPVARMATMAAADSGVSREVVQQLGLVPEQITVRATCVATWALLD